MMIRCKYCGTDWELHSKDRRRYCNTRLNRISLQRKIILGMKEETNRTLTTKAMNQLIDEIIAEAKEPQ